MRSYSPKSILNVLLCIIPICTLVCAIVGFNMLISVDQDDQIGLVLGLILLSFITIIFILSEIEFLLSLRYILNSNTATDQVMLIINKIRLIISCAVITIDLLSGFGEWLFKRANWEFVLNLSIGYLILCGLFRVISIVKWLRNKRKCNQ